MTKQDARSLREKDKITDGRKVLTVVHEIQGEGQIIGIRAPHSKTQYVLAPMLKRFQRTPESTRKGRK